jgi:hypothetical protein
LGAERVDSRAAIGEATILDAFRARQSGFMVESAGLVYRLLADDREGSRHQRFLLHLDSGHSLLISHNIDLAERVPVAVGDRLRFRGMYEWNERGGVIHWTHHDPKGRREGGWIQHEGLRFD